MAIHSTILAGRVPWTEEPGELQSMGLQRVGHDWVTNTQAIQFSSVTQLCPTLRPHGLQHARLPCPLPTTGAYSNSCPSSRWWHPTISSSVVPFSSRLQSFPSIRVFSGKSALRIRWPKYWSFSFSISPSNEYSRLMSFRMDWLDLLAVQEDSQESSLTPQFKSINSLALSFLYSPTLTSMHNYRKNHSFD